MESMDVKETDGGGEYEGFRGGGRGRAWRKGVEEGGGEGWGEGETESRDLGLAVFRTNGEGFDKSPSLMA